MTVTRFSTGQRTDNGLAGGQAFFALSDMEKIADIVVGSSGAASVTFSNIPQQYRALQIRGNAFSASTVNSGLAWVRLNGSFNMNTTDANYAIHQLSGNGSAASSYAETSSRKGFGIAGRNSMIGPSAFVADILDYANTVKNKTIRCLYGIDNNDSNGTVGVLSELWMNTAAISSITLSTEDGSNFKQFSTFALYGIL